MTGLPAEADRRTAPAAWQHGTAFGLAVQVDPRIDIGALLADGAAAVAQPPTRVLIAPEQLERRWRAVTEPQRVREAVADGHSQLTVDFAAQTGYLMWRACCGRTLISEDGTEMLCAPEQAGPDWSAIVTAQGLPLAATLRGLEPFHAAGVVIDGKARLLAGTPGVGKSSIAAALMRDGAQLLGDDGIAIQRSGDRLMAHPGMRSLHLRAAEESRLSADERAQVGAREDGAGGQSATGTASSAGKRRYLVESLAAPAPLGELFLLERSRTKPVIERLERVDPFSLLASTFTLSVRTPERLARHLDLVAAIAATGRVYSLRVHPDTDATRMAEELQRHMASG